MRYARNVFAVFVVLALVTLPAVSQTIKRGKIKGQSVSWTTGTVSVVKTANGHEVRFGDDFKTKRGPSLWVYVGDDRPEKRIGKLKAISGSQVYKVPASLNPADYSKIYIYCVPFQAIFGKANLR